MTTIQWKKYGFALQHTETEHFCAGGKACIFCRGPLHLKKYILGRDLYLELRVAGNVPGLNLNYIWLSENAFLHSTTRQRVIIPSFSYNNKSLEEQHWPIEEFTKDIIEGYMKAVDAFEKDYLSMAAALNKNVTKD